jgi:hypothetical protein
MKYVIVNKETNQRLNGGRSYKTLAAAKGAMTRRKLGDHLEAISLNEWIDRDIEVEVINLLSGKPVKIRKSQEGGCCDPSTEKYWSM